MEKKMKIKLISLACILTAVLLAFCSCFGGDKTDTSTNTTCQTNTNTQTNTSTNTDTEPTEIAYTVRVVDFDGTPISSGLFIQLYKDGTEVGGMKKANSNGEVSYTLEKGEYTFEVITADGKSVLDASKCVLTEKKPTNEVVVYDTVDDNSITIYPYDENLGESYAYEAKFVTEGATIVDIDKMSYYIFQPTRGGIYRFSYISDVALTIGYYGRADYVLDYSIADVVDGAFEVEVLNDSVSNDGGGTTRMTIGVKSLAVKNCILVIERISDPKPETPRVDYVGTEIPKEACKYNYLNYGFIDLDVTNPSLTIVYNKNDGFYHYETEDGPIVLVRIKSHSKYIASFFEMCETTNLFAIIKDDNGDPIRYEIYNSMINSYAEKCDDAGVVPLTKELEYAIKNIGEQQGWWGDNTIFKDGGSTDEDGNVIEGTPLDVNKDVAWMFACCYVNENAKGSQENKIVITDTAEKKELYAKVDKGCEIFIKSSQQIKATLTVENANGLVVTYNSQEYTADENGQIVIVMSSATPIEFSIENTSEEDKDITFTYMTYLG